MKQGYSVTLSDKGTVAHVKVSEGIMDEFTIKKICEEHDLLTSGVSIIKIEIVDFNNDVRVIETTPDKINNLKY